MGEVVSQCKFFADFGATAALGNILASAGGSRQLTKVKSADVKDDRDVEVVMAVGVEQGAGFRDKQGGGEISLQVYRETTKTPETDWRKLKTDRKVFTFTIADEGNGLRESFTCRVAKVDSKDDEAGVHEDTVTLKFTKRYKS
jgi:hypothetical protein